MDESATRALRIAVSLFVTLVIASGVLIMYGIVQTTYKQVYETDISFKEEFGEYENTRNTFIDVLNTYSRYKGRSDVAVYCTGASNIANDVNILVNYDDHMEDLKQNTKSYLTNSDTQNNNLDTDLNGIFEATYTVETINGVSDVNVIRFKKIN